MTHHLWPFLKIYNKIDIQIVCFRHIMNHNVIEIAVPWTPDEVVRDHVFLVRFDIFAHRLDLSNRVPSWYLRLSIIQIFGVLNQSGSLLVTTISTFWARHAFDYFHHNCWRTHSVADFLSSQKRPLPRFMSGLWTISYGPGTTQHLKKNSFWKNSTTHWAQWALFVNFEPDFLSDLESGTTSSKYRFR